MVVLRSLFFFRLKKLKHNSLFFGLGGVLCFCVFWHTDSLLSSDGRLGRGLVSHLLSQQQVRSGEVGKVDNHKDVLDTVGKHLVE
jgi:hypothetical protein